MKEACNFHINEIIEEHMENQQCCQCCETAFTNRGEKDSEAVPRQCYNSRCPCWDIGKACVTCRQECSNDPHKYLPKSKPQKDSLVKGANTKKNDSSDDADSPSETPKQGQKAPPSDKKSTSSKKSDKKRSRTIPWYK